jgi:hypothetical protein
MRPGLSYSRRRLIFGLYTQTHEPMADLEQDFRKKQEND